jgi:hypothetical protein
MMAELVEAGKLTLDDVREMERAILEQRKAGRTAKSK